MSNIKKFNEFLNEGVENVRNLSELRNIEQWIESFWSKIEDLDEVTYANIFNEIEDMFGETATKIIDGRYSADKLHYNQTGNTVATGGIDTGDFIEDFENIRNGVDSILAEYSVSESKTFESYNDNDELADWQQRWDQLLMDMEEEADPEGGFVADEYARKMAEMERQKKIILSKQKKSSATQEEFDVNEEKYNYLRQHLNDKQAHNIISWVEVGKNKEFVKVRLEFYGISPEEVDKMLKLLYEKDLLGTNSLISQYGEGSFESIKRFKDFIKINESSNIEELLANPENMWIVYVGEEPIGGMEFLNDAFNDVLMYRVADTEEEEYDFQERVDNILMEIGDEYDEVDQDELDDKIDEMMNEMGKTPVYRIKKRSSIEL